MADESSDASSGEAQAPSFLNVAIPVVLVLACVIAVAVIVIYFGISTYGKGNMRGRRSNVSRINSRRSNASARANEDLALKELRAQTQRIKVVVERLLNFTEAEDYCRSMKPPKQLFFPKDATEEKALKMKMVMLIPDAGAVEPNSEIRQSCGNDFLLGIRKVLDKDWKTNDQDFLFGSMFLSEMFLTSKGHCLGLSDDSSEQCTGLIKDKGKLLLRTIDCDISDSWNHILCQSKCANSSTGFCYNIYKDQYRTDLDEAREYCANLAVGSSIASIKHKKVLDEISKQIKSAIGDCEIVGIGHRLARKYESIKEIPLSYQTKQIVYRAQKKSSYNCIGVTIETEFKWEPIDCAEQNCFVCN